MYVAISQRLISDVSRKVRDMQSKEQASVNARFPSVTTVSFTGQEDWLHEELWGTNLHNLWKEGKLPAELQLRTATVQFSIKEVGNGNNHCGATVTGAPRHRLVDKDGRFLYSSAFKVAVSKDQDPQFGRVYDYYKEANEVQVRWDKIGKQVQEFLNSCKSLNEGLKVWPDLRLYVPKEYLDKVEEKQARSKSASSQAAEKLKAMDLDTITTSAVISWISDDTAPTK